MQFFPHAEGYVKPKDGGGYLYVYQYKDHLGNVRLSYADLDGSGTIESGSEILEEKNYYPFGLQHDGYNMGVKPQRSVEAEQIKYNGKEFEDSFGLNMYEMDLRQYDPAIGRWIVQDPVVHHDFSPYSAFDNNPVYWADPSGADATPIMLDGKLVGASFRGQDAIDAFNTLTGNESSSKTFETTYQNFYEMSSPNEENGGGNGNGGGIKTLNPITEYFFKNGFSILNSFVTGTTGQFRHLLGPDAIILTKTFEAGAGIGGTVGSGYIIILNGDYAGAYKLDDYGVGISTIDISTGFSAQAVYYSGSIKNITPSEFAGSRFAGSLGLKELGYLGINGGYSKSEKGVNIISFGFSIGLGVSATGLSGSINYGNTVIKY